MSVKKATVHVNDDSFEDSSDSEIEASTVGAGGDSATRTKRSTSGKRNSASAKSAKSGKKKSKKKQSLPKDTSMHNTTQEIRNQIRTLKPTIQSCFDYELKEPDFFYLQDFFDELPKIKDIWNRIGFNKETQAQRLDKLYENLIDKFHSITEGEIELEARIMASIDDSNMLINELCLELSLKRSDLKLRKPKSILDEDELLTSEVKRLGIEKKKRMDDYHKLLAREHELCDKLSVSPTEKRLTVPSESQLNHLSSRIKELSQLCIARKAEMSRLKEEIIQLSEDLELSRSDSFAELIIMESEDMMPLGEEDMRRAQEFRDELKQKDTALVNEIRSLRFKIKELWSKLGIENNPLERLVLQDQLTDTKRNVVAQLRDEHESCVRIKMANMQKFIESVRVEIRDLCDKMFIGPNEMKSLQQNLLARTDFTEELLTLHEQKKEELEFKFAESQALYEKTGKWLQLWSSFVEFEEKTKDPQRFKVRGYNMLAEEKQRKVFNSQLPKLEEELEVLAQEYSTTNDREQFHIYGLYYAEYMARKKEDHEESKQNERKEKQIMRDNIKKNESKFGSKPITPLAIRNKRKLLTTHRDSQLATPSKMRNSKLIKTDVTCTPGTLLGESKFLGASAKISTIKAAPSKVGHAGVKPKLSVAAKRKSKTPAKNRFRRSRGLNLMSQVNAADVTAVSNADTTIKTTISGSSSYQTINSTTGSNNSKSLINNSKIKLNALGIKVGVAGAKYPPLSSSSKFVAACSNRIEVMTSTASNTFIEEENFENIEHVDETVLSQKQHTKTAAQTTKAAAKKLSALSCATNKFNFNFQSDLNTNYNQEVNYTEFSRDLPRPSKNYEYSNQTTSSVKMSGRLEVPTTRSTALKDKLTSTLLKD